MLAGLTLMLLALPTDGARAVQIQPNPAASGPWLDRLNAWRFNTGVSLLTENSTWSAGDYDHALYMVKNDLVTHYETAGTPYYTVAGDTAAKDGNIFVSSSTGTTDTQAIDWWMQAPFHSMALMDPRLSSSGFGSYRQVKSGWDMAAAVDVVRGNSFSGGQFPVTFPGNGTTEPLTTFSGGEWPDPLQACSGYTAPAGLPVYIEVGGNVHTTVGPVHSFTSNGVPLSHCVIDSNNTALGSFLQERGAVILIPQKPLGTGVTYTVALTVNGVPHTWSFSVGSLAPVVTNPCTAVTASTAPVSPAAPGAQVLITGVATGCPNPRYRFWVRPPGGAWSIAQDYSASNTFNWTQTALSGSYSIEVDARNATESVAYDVVTNFAYSLSGCSAVSLAANPASPVNPGPSVVLTASPTCAATPVYRFWTRPPGGAWSIAQDYSASAAFNWATSGLARGSYALEVDVRSAGSTDAYQAVSNLNYVLGINSCAAPTLGASPVSPGATGTPVTFTATTASCANPRYRFWVRAPGGAWRVAQDYSATSTFAWHGDGVIGSYGVEVDVRDASESVAYDAVKNVTYTVGGCSAASLAPSPASGGLHGTAIALTASATCPGTPAYRFWVRASGGAWTVVQGYGTSNSYSWTPLVAGTYYLEVDVMDQGATGAYEKVYNLTYVVS